MHLSVVIPTHNRRALVLQAIESIVSQSYFASMNWHCGVEYEIIVVDDGSEDGTPSAIHHAYPHVTVIEQSNLGVSEARNAGLREAGGEWLAFLDSDDVWLPSKLTVQFEALNRRGALASYCEEIWMRNGAPINPKVKNIKPEGMIYSDCVARCVLAPSSVVLHRSVLDRVGCFDPSLVVCEDYDLWLRVSAHYPVIRIDTPQVIRAGGHTDQLSMRYWGMDQYRVMGLEKILLMAESDSRRTWLLTPEHLDLTLANLLQRLTVLELGARKHKNYDLLHWITEKNTHWHKKPVPNQRRATQ